MKTTRALGLIAASILLINSWTDQASAALSWEFGFTDRVNNFEGTGSFTLGGPDGPPSDLLAFAFNGVCGEASDGSDNLCSFGLDELQGATWELNDDWTFASLNLGAFFGVLGGPDFNSLLVLTQADLSLDCAILEGNECNGGGFDDRLAVIGEGAFLTPIHEAPEPSTFALFAIALGGLGFMARRRARS